MIRTQNKYDDKMSRIMTYLLREDKEGRAVPATLGCILRIVLLILWYVAGDEGVDKA